MPPGSAGAWDDGSRDYRGDDGYPADGARGYGQSGGYPTQGYGPRDGQYSDPYGQQPYDRYPAEQGQGGGGYGGPQGYQREDRGYGRSGGYPTQGQPQGYEQRPASGNGAGGYQDPSTGAYGYQSGGYPTSPAGGRSAPRRGGSGAYPALPQGGTGGYPTEDAGNDWYGGQPAAAKGASFADTGAYALNGRIIDEYGTGPRRAMRDPAHGYPPGPGQGSGPMPTELFDENGQLLRERGHEYGTNTGRERRCGWFDAVAGRFVAQLNGLTSAVITKLDVLDTLPVIKICTAYQLRGKLIHNFPATQSDLAACEPVYEEVEGWQCDTSGVTTYEELPAAARNYLKRLEELLETPISLVSVSPQRGRTIQVQDVLATPEHDTRYPRNAAR